MKNETGIYIIVNRLTNKVYIGSASMSIQMRLSAHRTHLRKGSHHNRHLQCSWNKYGEGAFEFKVLEKCAPEMCIIREQHWIDVVRLSTPKRLYNISPTAGSSRGVKLSPETCKRISASKRGVKRDAPMSQEARQKLSVALTGNKNGQGKHRVVPKEECERRIVRMEGRRFQRLVVVRFHDLKPHARWLCRCDCGKEVVVYGNNLRKGNTHSCGCLLTDALTARNKGKSWARKK